MMCLLCAAVVAACCFILSETMSETNHDVCMICFTNYFWQKKICCHSCTQLTHHWIIEESTCFLIWVQYRIINTVALSTTDVPLQYFYIHFCLLSLFLHLLWSITPFCVVRWKVVYEILVLNWHQLYGIYMHGHFCVIRFIISQFNSLR